MRQAIRYAAILLALNTGLTSASASNTYFLPGDAFYHTILTEDLVTWIQNEESPVFEYRRPAHFPGTLCGNAGYSRIAFKKMPVAFKQNLRVAYFDLRNKYRKSIDVTYYGGKESLRMETNGFHLFFYNEDFQLNKSQPAVKYNEALLHDDLTLIPAIARDIVRTRLVPNGFGIEIKDGPTLERFVPDWDGSEHRDAKEVAPLNVTYPNGEDVKVPTMTSGIKCLIVTKEELKRFATTVSPDPLSPLQLNWAVQVNEKGIQKLTRDKRTREWKSTLFEHQSENDKSE